MSTVERRNSGKIIPFMEKAEDLKYTQLAHQRYADFDGPLEQEDLVDYILGEVERLRADMEKDVCSHLTLSRRLSPCHS